jgi:hypothetical protein
VDEPCQHSDAGLSLRNRVADRADANGDPSPAGVESASAELTHHGVIARCDTAGDANGAAPGACANHDDPDRGPDDGLQRIESFTRPAEAERFLHGRGLSRREARAFVAVCRKMRDDQDTLGQIAALLARTKNL